MQSSRRSRGARRAAVAAQREGVARALDWYDAVAPLHQGWRR